MKEVVINRCYGGFGLSVKAIREYLKRKENKVAYFYIHNYTADKHDKRQYIRVDKPTGKETLPYFVFTKDLGAFMSEWPKDFQKYYFVDRHIQRDDLILVAIVKKLGTKANTQYSNLEIVEIPDEVDFTIEEYDGVEHIAEKHRIWS